jgi:hypothetical protein
MESSLLENEILAAAEVKGDRTILTGAAALALADKHGKSAADIGAVCNERKIKIVACKLGCFK